MLFPWKPPLLLFILILLNTFLFQKRKHHGILFSLKFCCPESLELDGERCKNAGVAACLHICFNISASQVQ